MLVLLQKLNIPKDSNYDEFMKYLLENKDYKNFCQEENSKEAQNVYQRMLKNANHPGEIRKIQNDFSNNIQNKEKMFPLLFIKNFIAKNQDVKIDANNREKTHICQGCNNSFPSANHLKIHINSVHNGIKDYKCVLCERSFSLAGDLKKHNNAVHNGQKDHKCDSCGKAFSQGGHLNTHINAVHNEQKDHKCDSCGKSFSIAGSLKIHIIAVHDGQKEHKCDSCGKSFSRAGNLKKHVNAVHT